MVAISIDEFQQKIMLEGSFRYWLLHNYNTIKRYADENIAYESRITFFENLDAGNLLIAYYMIKQDSLSNQEKISRIIKSLVDEHGKLYAILGAKRSGKTHLAYTLAEKCFNKGETICYFGPPVKTPDFITVQTMKINNIPSNSTTIIDEASIQFFSRDSNRLDQSDFTKKLASLAHSNRNIIFITQNLFLNDVNFMRTLDGIFFKTYALLQDDNDRIKIHEKLKVFMPSTPEKTLFYSTSQDYPLLSFTQPLAGWWSEKLSKPYSKFTSEAEKLQYIVRLIPELDDEQIAEQLNLKGETVDPLEISRIRLAIEKYDINDLLNLDQEGLQQIFMQAFDDTALQKIRTNHIPIRANFTLPPIVNESLKIKLSRNELLAVRFHFNINDIFYNDIVFRARNKKNLIVSIFGETGSGKSLAAIALAELLARIFKGTFSEKNIYFSDEKLLNSLSSTKPKTTIIRDEQTKQFGVGSNRIVQEEANVEETIRKRQINLIYTSPEVKLHCHHYILETAGIDYENNLVKLIVYDPKMNPIGYITLAKPSKKIETAYEAKKDSFLDSIQQRTTSSKEYLKQLAKKVLKTELWHKAKTKTQKRIAIMEVAPNLTATEQDIVLAYTELIEFKES